MNKIQISSNNIDSNFDINISDNTIIIDDNANINLKIIINTSCKIFEYINNSKINNIYEINDNLRLNRFSINSSLNTIINLNKEEKHLDYFYGTINIDDNNYVIDINHNVKNTNSNIINHGINYSNNKLDFIINSRILKESINVNTNQDSKIILMQDNNCHIKPNLLVDNNDIVASHASFIGHFNKDKLFYLACRGINYNNSIKLLVKSFLLENKDINFLHKEMILKDINNYWR